MLTPDRLSAREVAAMFGFSRDTLRRRLADFEAHGFPRFDTLLRGYLRADVEAWLSGRRQVGQASKVIPKEVNHDAL